MSENPLKSDKKLQNLLTNVGSIQSGKALADWKASFLEVYKSYLDPDGVLNARDADDRLVRRLQGLAKASLRVQAFTESGHITTVQVTAEGRRALAAWTEEISLAEDAVAKMCPKTSEEMDMVGYDKFELGAVLIQDGFQAYEIMLTNNEFIQELCNGPLHGVLEKSQLSIIAFYSREMQSFVEIMTDLGLLKLMKRCVSVYQEEERPDRTKEPDTLTKRDTKGVVVDVMHDKGSDNVGSTSKGSKVREPGKAGEGKTAKLGKKTKGRVKDVLCPQSKDDEEKDEPPPEDGDGDEGKKIIYFDPKTGNVGLLVREKCMANELMFVPNGQGGAENNGVIDCLEEKANVVWLLKKMEKKKPKEGEWLEKIKKEKAQKAKEGNSKTSMVRVTKDSVKESQRQTKPKRPVRKLSSSNDVKPKPAGFKNPLDESTGPKPNKSGVQDYNGMYQKVAPKPADGGWNKVTPDEASKD